MVILPRTIIGKETSRATSNVNGMVWLRVKLIPISFGTSLTLSSDQGQT